MHLWILVVSHCTVHVRILFGGWGRVFQISLTRAGPCIRSTGNLMFNLTFYLVWEPATWYCISIVWLTAVLTDHCGLRYQPIEVQYCFEGIYCHVTSFQLIAGAVFSEEGSCVYELHYKKFDLKLTSAWFGWFQTDLGCKNSASFRRQRR